MNKLILTGLLLSATISVQADMNPNHNNWDNCKASAERCSSIREQQRFNQSFEDNKKHIREQYQRAHERAKQNQKK